MAKREQGKTKAAALENGAENIRVNSVAPGLIRTRLTRYVTEIPENAAGYLENIPLRRFGEPADVAAAIAFLASDDAAWITGADLVVDGGYTSASNRSDIITDIAYKDVGNAVGGAGSHSGAGQGTPRACSHRCAIALDSSPSHRATSSKICSRSAGCACSG